MGNNFCIVRCRNAGVHAGTLVSRDAETLVLKNSRRLWRWRSKFTLSELAVGGPVGGASANKYGTTLPELTLTVFDVCEVIPCTESAAKAIAEVPDYDPS